jgi:hypothetical protein
MTLVLVRNPDLPAHDPQQVPLDAYQAIWRDKGFRLVDPDNHDEYLPDVDDVSVEDMSGPQLTAALTALGVTDVPTKLPERRAALLEATAAGESPA